MNNKEEKGRDRMVKARTGERVEMRQELTEKTRT